jgi:hypothetical protein
MQLDHRQSAAILSFPQTRRRKAGNTAGRHEHADRGRVANLALMFIVLALAGLWLAFPPAQLSAGSTQEPSLQNTGR